MNLNKRLSETALSSVSASIVDDACSSLKLREMWTTTGNFDGFQHELVSNRMDTTMIIFMQHCYHAGRSACTVQPHSLCW